MRIAPRLILTFLLLLAPTIMTNGRVERAGSRELPWDPPSTFSILGYDPDTGEIGAAVQSRVFSVGHGVLWAGAGVGVAATQAIVDVGYGPKALALLRAGLTPDAIVKAIL